ncbi:4a-hydroxytetrahydrobiopterin dehydratase [Hydrogenivirga sp.]
MRAFSEREVEDRLSQLEGWSYEEGYIVKEYETRNWKTTLFVVNTIAALAEIHWHHPDLEVSFKKVKVWLTTHEAEGITDRDFRLAEEIDAAVREVMKH